MVFVMKKKLTLLAIISILPLISSCNQHEAQQGVSSDEEISSEISSSKDTSVGLSGDGKEESPYIITNAKGLRIFSLKMSVRSNPLKKEVYASLANDIDLEGEEFAPIGSMDHPFYGVFDGKGHTIKNLSITKYDEKNYYYGLFGVAYYSEIKNVNLTYNIDLTVTGKGIVYAASILATSLNTYVTYCHAEGNIHVTSNQSGEGSATTIGGVVGLLYTYSHSIIDLYECTQKGDLIVTATGKDTVTYAGGIVGYCYTTLGLGTIEINRVQFEGSISARDIAGGIVGLTDLYLSINEAVASGNYIRATRVSDSLVGVSGGIIGFGYAETIALNTIAVFEEISSAKSANSSIAGGITGYYETDKYDVNQTYRGSAVAKSVSIISKTSSDQKGLDGKRLSSLSSDIYKTVSLSDAWEKPTNALPKLIRKTASTSEEDESYVTVTLDPNYEGFVGETVVVKMRKHYYDISATYKVDSAKYTRKGYSFFNYFYEPDCQTEYRWYCPYMQETTLYAEYGNTSEIKGNYASEDRSLAIGIEGDEKLTLIDHMRTITYAYSYYEGHLFLKKDKESGDLAGEVFYLENGSLKNDYFQNQEKSITLGKVSSLDLPSYNGKEFLTDFFSLEGNRITFLKDGNLKFMAGGNNDSALYDGGYRYNETESSIKVYIKGYSKGESTILLDTTFTYNKEKNFLYNEQTAYATDPISKEYQTSDKSIRIYLTDVGDTYVIDKMNLVTMSGSLKEGETIVINGKNYLLQGDALIEK